MMRSSRHWLGLFLVLALLLVALAAQSRPENQLARIFFFDVKTGMEMQFETALKAHVQWRKEHGDTWQWIAYQIVNGERFGDYVVRSGDHTWADLDSYQEFLDKGAVHFYASTGPYLDSVAGYITRTDPGISRWPAEGDPIRYLQVIDYWIKPDSVPQFMAAVKQVHEAIGTSGWPAHYSWEITLNGGRGGNMTLVLPYANFAAMEGPEQSMDAMLTQVYGAEKAQQIFGAIQSSVDHTESHVARVRPDLSVIP